MSRVSLPVTRPAGRALIVGGEGSREEPANLLRQQGFHCQESPDPYAAMAELCGNPPAYKALVLSLSGLYREELQVVAAVKRRFSNVEIWLTHADGRMAALAEAMRFGADGLLSEDGFHRTSVGGGGGGGMTSSPPAGVAVPALPHGPSNGSPGTDGGDADACEPEAHGEPVLSAEELRALLQEQPYSPPAQDPG